VVQTLPVKEKTKTMSGKLRRHVLLVFILGFCVSGFTQPLMKRSSFAGTYTDISVAGGATLSSASGDNAIEDLIPIGFTFNYLGTNYSTIGVSTNGIAAFTGITSSANNMDLYTSSAPNTVLAPWWDDLKVQTGTGSILYQLQGIPGNRTFTIQWTDVNSYATGSTSLLNFQVILFEQSNKIEFRYGTLTSGIFNTANESASIGIKSAVGGSSEFIDAVTGSSFTGNGMLSPAKTWPSHFFRFLPGASTPVAAGIYTVGVSGDYYSMSEAIADINHCGVSGTIIFSLTDTLYDETAAHGGNFFPMLIGPVTGTGINSSVTFQTIVPNGVIVRSPGCAAGNCATENSLTAIDTTNEPVISLIGTRYVSLASLRIQSTFSGTDRGVLVQNSSSMSGTRNCGLGSLQISLDRSNLNSIGIEQKVNGIVSYTGANSWNVYQSITVTNAYCGIKITGDAALPDSGVTVTTSIIGTTDNDNIGNGNASAYGIYAKDESGINITGNICRNITVSGNADVTGILLENGKGTCVISGNKTRSLRNSSTTALNAVTGISAAMATSGVNELRIFNNFIYGLNSSYNGSATSAVQVKGICVQPQGAGSATNTIHVDFNNVSINANILISSACFESGTVSGPVIHTRNNIFCNSTIAQNSPAGHYCFVTPGINSVGNTGSVSNNNDLFITNATRGFIGKGSVSSYASLSNWQTAMNGDALSLNLDPQFFSTTDLHILNPALNAGGMNLAWVTTDFDNQVRYAIPDIGADEIFPPDPSPIALINPTTGNCFTNAEPVIVRVMNAGNSLIDFTIDTVPLTVQITGAITQTLTILIDDNSRNNGDPLPIGSYVDVDLGTIDMSGSGTYYFNVHTSLSYDGDPLNDTLPQVTIVNVAPQVHITGNTSICEASSTVLTAHASGGDGNYSYQWSYGLGTSQSVTVSPTHDSLFYVSITDGCGVFANDSVLIHIMPDPTAQFSYNITNNTVSFTDNSLNATGWSWNFGDSQGSNQANPSHTYATTGTYTVVLIAANACGVDSTTEIISIITTGIADVTTGDFGFYPNPAGEHVTLVLPSAAQHVRIELEDLNGKLLLRKEPGNTKEGTNFVVDLSGYEDGIYFLRVSTDEFSSMKKLVIKK
jgi:PKD repeat protein